MLSIIIPCYNEEKNIPLIMERFSRLRKEESFELIVVNNASTDGTGPVLELFQQKPEYDFFRVVNEPIPGYGRAIMAGLRAATGTVLAWTHADLQTDPADVISAATKLEKEKRRGEGAKLAVKGRRMKRGGIEGWFTLGMGMRASVLLCMKLWDVNAQPKVFGLEFLALMTNPPGDFSLDLYWLWLAKKHGYTVLTVPVDFGKRLHGESKSAPNLMGKMKTSWRTIKYIFILMTIGWDTDFPDHQDTP